MSKVQLNYSEDPKIRSMRVRAWFHVVSCTSGLNAIELEARFRESQKGRVSRSCIWDKYRRGEVVPRSGPSKPGEGSRLVERVEACYPGTKWWLVSPLWRVIDNAPVEMMHVRGLYEVLPANLRAFFILPPEQMSKIFWRKPLDPQGLYDALQSEDDLYKLFVALGMIREAEVIQIEAMHVDWINVADSLLGNMDWGVLETSSIPKELRKYLRARWAGLR